MSRGEGPVLVARRAHVVCITLNRPEVRNAINAETSAAVGTALEEAEKDDDVRAVVLTGAGGRSFCAGADLRELAEGRSVLAPGREEWGFAGFVRHMISKPTIAAVDGCALGGGTELALACDLVVASEDAVFGLPEVTRGIIAAAGGVIRLPEQIPHKVAMHAILTGDPMPASRCLELGLINEVVPAGTALERAFDLAGRIAGNAPLAVRASKRVARGIVDGEIAAEHDAWRSSAEEMQQVSASLDAREGPRAFIEKRRPRWSGQ